MIKKKLGEGLKPLLGILRNYFKEIYSILIFWFYKLNSNIILAQTKSKK